MIRKSLLPLAITLTFILTGCSGDDGVNSPTGPEISLSSKSLTFSAQAGMPNPPSQKVVVYNAGTGTLTFNATESADWITISRTPEDIYPDTIRVAVSTAQVGSGVHVDTITVTSSVAHNSPQYIVVTFTVDQTIDVSPKNLFFPWVAGAETPDSQVFEILNVGDGDMTYTITKSASWLSLSHNSGTAPDSVGVSVDPTGLEAGVHIDSLVIASPDAANGFAKLAVTLAISSWFAWNEGLSENYTLQGLTFLNNNTAWALGSILNTSEHTGVAFRRSDVDASWEQILSVRNAEFGGMAFSTDSIACVVGDTTMIMRTTDAGATWDTIEPIPMDSTSAIWAIIFASPDTGFCVGPLGTIIRTIDAGLSWQAQSSPVTTSLAALASADNNNVWLTGNHGEILHTSNGGDNWTMQNSGTTTDLFEIEFIDYLQGWAVGGNGIVIHTLDGGVTWERQDVGVTTNLHDVYFFTEMRGWIIGDMGTIVHTSDGGQNWIRQFLPDPLINQPSLYEIEFLAGDTGVVVGAGGAVYRTVSGGF